MRNICANSEFCRMPHTDTTVTDRNRSQKNINLSNHSFMNSFQAMYIVYSTKHRFVTLPWVQYLYYINSNRGLQMVPSFKTPILFIL